VLFLVMPKPLLALIAFLSCFASDLSAQYNTPQNKVWTFGYHYGLDFNSGSPVPFNSSMYTIEGCASVCNASGTLLFYTSGDSVYDATGAIMPHGAGH